jgi:hypothetical protein
LPPFRDLTGQKYGHLTVVRRIAKKDRTYWLCRCNCGTEKVIQGSHLRSGMIISCGCVGKSNRERALRNGSKQRAGKGSFTAAIRKVMREYQNSARVDGRAFLLSEKDFTHLLVEACFYCGKAPSRSVKLNDGTSYLLGGIDRVDNNRGYLRENVVPCCRTCNLHKAMKTPQAFVADYLSVLIQHRQGSPYGARSLSHQQTRFRDSG